MMSVDLVIFFFFFCTEVSQTLCCEYFYLFLILSERGRGELLDVKQPVEFKKVNEVLKSSFAQVDL